MAQKDSVGLKDQLKDQDEEMKELRNELDLVKRRIERQENDYIQTMKYNTLLKNQMYQLQENANAKSKDAEIQLMPDARALQDLTVEKFQLKQELQELQSKLENTFLTMRNQHDKSESEKNEMIAQMRSLQYIVRKKDT